MKVAYLLLALLVLAGVTMLCAGVYFLVGKGWCLISGAAVAFVVASILLRGLRSPKHG